MSFVNTLTMTEGRAILAEDRNLAAAIMDVYQSQM